MTTVQFTKEQLFADLKKDGITVDANRINKAKNGDGLSIWDIGLKYSNKQKYDKAMAWYRLAAVKNNSNAQTGIGYLYHNGLGVPKDYFLAMEWWLKAAVQNEIYSWENIGGLFNNGQGVPVDKYKALEWYRKCGNKLDKVKALTDQGIQLTQQDKNKPIGQLIMETEDIVRETRKKRENRLDEINTLTQLLTKMRKESSVVDFEPNSLEEEIQSLRATVERQQKELDIKQKVIEQYKTNEQIKKSEIKTLKYIVKAFDFRFQEKQDAIKDLERTLRFFPIEASKGSSTGYPYHETEAVYYSDFRNVDDLRVYNIKHTVENIRKELDWSQRPKDIGNTKSILW